MAEQEVPILLEIQQLKISFKAEDAQQPRDNWLTGSASG
jgi:hypothetical protein